MLIDQVVTFCDEMYSSFGKKCGCKNGICNHPSGSCSQSCYECLYQIHFPNRAPENAKTEYDCVKMLYHYVCQYSYLYTTELLCAFEHEWDFIKDFPYYHILSLGCGGCADLMAFDCFRQKNKLLKSVSYIGIDVNNLWSPIHLRVGDYCRKNGLTFRVQYDDVYQFFAKRKVLDTNIVVISYLISYLYNTDQIDEINNLAKSLSEKVIQKKGTPLLLIINDVNSYKRGRDSFSCFEKTIRRCGLRIKSKYKYFDTGNLFEGQKLGSPYSVNQVPFIVPDKMKAKYHACTSINQTVQLLVEVS